MVDARLTHDEFYCELTKKRFHKSARSRITTVSRLCQKTGGGWGVSESHKQWEADVRELTGIRFALIGRPTVDVSGGSHQVQIPLVLLP